MMPAGQGIEVVREILPAGDIVRSIAAEADRVLAQISQE